MLGPVIYVIYDADKDGFFFFLYTFFFITSNVRKISGVGALRFRQHIHSCYVSFNCCISLFPIKHEWHVWMEHYIPDSQ